MVDASPLQVVTSARGPFGPDTVFSTHAGKSYAKRRTSPRLSRTDASCGVRALNSFLSNAWKSLPSEVRSSWQTTSITGGLDLFNEFYKYNFVRFRSGRGYVSNRDLFSSDIYVTDFSYTLGSGPGNVVLEGQKVATPDSIVISPLTEYSRTEFDGPCVASGLHDGKTFYRYAPMALGLIFWDSVYEEWLFTPYDTFTEYPSCFHSPTLESSIFIDFTGNYDPSITGPLIPGSVTPAPEFLAIFRHDSFFSSPDPRFLRSIIPFEPAYSFSFIDTNKIGNRPPTRGGLSRGRYWYAWQPLASDGRLGSLSTPIALDVS